MAPSIRNVPSIVITGASTGIGEASALELDRLGFRVFAGVRSPSDGQRLKSKASARMVPLLIDVTDDESIAEAVGVVAESVGEGGLAGLVNNAGIVVAGPLELLPIGEVRKQMEVNVIGQIAVTKEFLPLVRKACGRIVLMGSLNGRIASPYLGPYSASKHAMEAVALALRIELRKWRISVSLIEPGGTATPIWGKSLASADALAANASADRMKMYQSDLDAVRRATARLADAASPVDGVVRTIVHALTSSRPKARYPVGLQTNLLFRAIKWVPDRLWDRIVQRSLGLS
jgi:NAD(P)-dependent dehydrogenase (short-subunit alcohol dehydrogenase family)